MLFYRRFSMTVISENVCQYTRASPSEKCQVKTEFAVVPRQRRVQPRR